MSSKISERSSMRKLILVSLLLLFFLHFGIGNVLAQGIEIDGFLESYYSIKLKEDNDIIGDRSRIRLNIRNSSNNIYMFVSLAGTSNRILETNTDLELEVQEAYFEYNRALWDLKVGRQIYSWGKADGVRITDVLSPCDYSEYITRDFDEIRIPVDSIRYRYLFPAADLELVWIPTFTEAIYPETEQNPWFRERKNEINTNQAISVDDKVKNSELAARLSFYLNGIDFSFSTAYLWDDEAAYHKTDSNSYTPEHHRLKFYGLDISKPINDFVLRFESAYYQGKYFSAANSKGVFESDYIHSLAGLDWYPGNNWTVTGQLVNKHIFNYKNAVQVDQDQNVVTLNISKKLLRETLKLENMIYYGFNNEDGFNRSSLDYAINDELHFLAGIDYFFGDEGEFGSYDNNDSLWFKIKYSF